jgi:hypothetical protein
MARRNALPSTLFPFMSVLACTIGALVVLLAIMSLSAVETSDAAQLALESRTSAAAVAQNELNRDEQVLLDAEAAWARLDDELASRGGPEGADAFDLRRWIERLRRKIDIRAALAVVEAEWKAVSIDRNGLETEIEVLQSRRETLPILIDPTGLSRQWKPYFIECDGRGVTAYRARDDLRYFVPRSEVAMIGDLARYLRRVRAESGALLVLLVRPDGLATADTVKALAEGAGIRVAKLPLPGEGTIDWSLLRRAESARPALQGES